MGSREDCPSLRSLITKAAVILPFEEPLLRGLRDRRDVCGPSVAGPAQEPARSRGGARAARDRRPTSACSHCFPEAATRRSHGISRPFIESGRELARRYPGLRVIVHAAPTVNLDDRDCPFELVRGASFELFRAADVALCKSGTTTLEAAIAQCPMAVAYRTSAYIVCDCATRGEDPVHRAGERRCGARGGARVRAGRARAARCRDRAWQAAGRCAVSRRTAHADCWKCGSKLGTPGAALRVAEMISGLAG